MQIKKLIMKYEFINVQSKGFFSRKELMVVVLGG